MCLRALSFFPSPQAAELRWTVTLEDSKGCFALNRRLFVSPTTGENTEPLRPATADFQRIRVCRRPLGRASGKIREEKDACNHVRKDSVADAHDGISGWDVYGIPAKPGGNFSLILSEDNSIQDQVTRLCGRI